MKILHYSVLAYWLCNLADQKTIKRNSFMNLPIQASRENTAPPSSAWIRFLRSYGPTPNNLTLFDEYVTDALGKAKVQPITLSSPLLEKIKERVDSGVPGSILIAGTAGDGKTYHCRGLWTYLGGSAL